MRAKCAAQGSDTPTSQLRLLDELLKLFRCNVEIKIWIHFGIPAKSLKTEPRTRWIRIEALGPEDKAIIEQIAGFCDGGIFAGDLYFQVETDLAVNCNAGEPGQDYVKLAVTHGLIEEYFSGSDQCYRRVTKGGEQE